MAFSKYLSQKQQQLIDYAYNNGHKISYKENMIFKNEKSFERSMKLLCVAKVFFKKHDGFYPLYQLMPKGKSACRIKIIPLVKS